MISNFNINDNVYEKFILAIQLNNESIDSVVERLLSEYAANSFSRAAKSLESKTESSSKNYLENVDIGKAKRKIPTWAYKPQQNNHRLIKAFMLIQEEQGKVPLDELRIRCTDKNNYPDTFIADFKGNFAQMKTDAGNSHGKVFVIEDDEVKIWHEVQPIIEEYSERFKGDGSMFDFIESSTHEGKGKMTITNDMTKEAYEIGKMVIDGKISRTEGRELISKKTGMAAASAQDYVTDFLAMIAGERYTRTLNLFATEYFLRSIKKDFGPDSFEKAISACQQHVLYYNSLGYGKQVKTQELINRLKEESF